MLYLAKVRALLAKAEAGGVTRSGRSIDSAKCTSRNGQLQMRPLDDVNSELDGTPLTGKQHLPNEALPGRARQSIREERGKSVRATIKSAEVNCRDPPRQRGGLARRIAGGSAWMGRWRGCDARFWALGVNWCPSFIPGLVARRSHLRKGARNRKSHRGWWPV
jgi:hypothetical protein